MIPAHGGAASVPFFVARASASALASRRPHGVPRHSWHSFFRGIRAGDVFFLHFHGGRGRHSGRWGNIRRPCISYLYGSDACACSIPYANGGHVAEKRDAGDVFRNVNGMLKHADLEVRRVENVTKCDTVSL